VGLLESGEGFDSVRGGERAVGLANLHQEKDEPTMPFTLEAFIALRPFLFHFTARENLAGIQKLRRLDSAARIAADYRTGDIGRKRHSALRIAGEPNDFWLQTQRPLYERNIHFEGEWTITTLLCCLNNLAFSGPVPWRGLSLMGVGIAPAINGPRML
jgi:hypothetical protein